MINLSADRILNPDGILVSDHMLILQDDGTIEALVPKNNSHFDFHEGILCPGFINSHLHLELSGLRNQISSGNGLDGFISQLVSKRNNEIYSPVPLYEADAQMWENGIQGAGDICNTTSTLMVKQQSKIRYQNFIEIFGFDTNKTDEVFHQGIKLLNEFTVASQSASLVPHAPYTVPPELFRLIAGYSEKYNGLWSMHNQESDSENILFIHGESPLLQLFQNMKLPVEWLNRTGKSSLESSSAFFPDKNNLLLVHNTFTGDDDLELLKRNNLINRTWFCLCVHANLFIENKLPDIAMLRKKQCKIVVGTDSLASNYELNILEELKTIHQHNPDIPISEILTWATANAADYFLWNDLGRFLPGNKPGIISISDSDEISFGKSSRVRRIF